MKNSSDSTDKNKVENKRAWKCDVASKLSLDS